MNDSPWKCNDSAFDVMFSDEAEFLLVDNEKSTVRCCVFPKEDVDPFVDSDNESMIMSATVLVKKCDWHFLNTRPSVGDQIRLPNGDKYKVVTVEAEQNWWKLNGRSVD